MADKTKEAVAELVTASLKKVAANPTSSLEYRDVAPAAKAVTDEVTAAVRHATNTEPWYQSRVTWGAIGAVALPILGILGVSSDVIEPDEFIALGMAAGTIFSGALTFYGRWRARKPIGA